MMLLYNGAQKIFSICNADHRLILYHSSNNLLELLSETFPELAYSPKHPFHSYPFPPGASREELLLFHCGLSGRIHRPTHLL